MTKKVLTILIIICIFSLQLSVGVFAERDHMADTWVGNDALGRRLPTNEQVGDRKEEKYVGIFYFLFMNAEQGRILDHSKVFAEDGVEAVWDVLVQDGCTCGAALILATTRIQMNGFTENMRRCLLMQA